MPLGDRAVSQADAASILRTILLRSIAFHGGGEGRETIFASDRLTTRLKLSAQQNETETKRFRNSSETVLFKFRFVVRKVFGEWLIRACTAPQFQRNNFWDRPIRVAISGWEVIAHGPR